MNYSKVQLLSLVCLVASSLAAMDGGGLKRLPQDELVNKAAKRHQVEDESAIRRITNHEYESVIRCFTGLYNLDHAQNAEQLLQQLGTANNVFVGVQQKVKQALAEANEISTRYSPFLKAKLRPQLKQIFEQSAQMLLDEGLITDKQRWGLMVATMEHAGLASDSDIQDQQVEVLHKKQLLGQLDQFCIKQRMHICCPLEKVPIGIYSMLFRSKEFIAFSRDVKACHGAEIAPRVLAYALLRALDESHELKESGRSLLALEYDQIVLNVYVRYLQCESDRYLYLVPSFGQDLIEKVRGLRPVVSLFPHKEYGLQDGLGLAPLVPLLLVMDYSTEELKELWCALARLELICCYSKDVSKGRFEELLEKRFDTVRNGLKLLLPALLQRGVSSEELLDMSLHYLGLDTSLQLLFSRGMPLPSDCIYTLASRPFNRARGTFFAEIEEHLDDFTERCFEGFAKTMRSLVYHARVALKMPDFQEFQNSRARIHTALCVFKRCCPGLLRDLRAKIFSSEQSLVQDVINAYLPTCSNRNLQWPSSFTFLKPLIDQKILKSEAVVAMLAHAKSDRVKQLLRYEKWGVGTPLACYTSRSTTQINSDYNPEDFDEEVGDEINEEMMQVARAQDYLFVPGKVEENFGELITQSVREQLQPIKE